MSGPPGSRRDVAVGLAVAIVATVAAWAARGDGADAAAPRYTLRSVVRGLNQPVYVTAPASERNRLYVVERRGVVRVAANGRLQARPFLDVQPLVDRTGERGLLSIAFSPGYASNGLVYAILAHDDDLELHEYRVAGGVTDPATDRLVLRVPHADSPYHNGGQLAFGRDGKLYVGIGDGGYTDVRATKPDPHGNSQNLDVLLGKSFRLDAGDAAPEPEIVAYGLRNPWRFSFDPAGNMVVGDVGWNTAEEVDVLPRGAGLANFGWSVYEGRARRSNATTQLNTAGTLRGPAPGAAGTVILPAVAGRFRRPVRVRRSAPTAPTARRSDPTGSAARRPRREACERGPARARAQGAATCRPGAARRSPAARTAPHIGRTPRPPLSAPPRRGARAPRRPHCGSGGSCGRRRLRVAAAVARTRRRRVRGRSRRLRPTRAAGARGEARTPTRRATRAPAPPGRSIRGRRPRPLPPGESGRATRGSAARRLPAAQS